MGGGGRGGVEQTFNFLFWGERKGCHSRYKILGCDRFSPMADLVSF